MTISRFGHHAAPDSAAHHLLEDWASAVQRAEFYERAHVPIAVSRRATADDLLARVLTAPGYLHFESRDVVVTVPASLWTSWTAEGDCAGEPRRDGVEYWFNVPSRPAIFPGARVYVVAHGKLRGYAPLWRIDPDPRNPRGCLLIRRGGAVAVTIDDPIRGFQGYRYRWWEREIEVPFEDWRTP